MIWLYCDGSLIWRFTAGPSWSGQKAMTSPGLACALMAAATALAWVRCVVTFCALEMSPATTARPTMITRALGLSSVVVPRATRRRKGRNTTAA